jgi:hypothetical protein
MYQPLFYCEKHQREFAAARTRVCSDECPVTAPNGHADPIERCPLLGAQRKTSARDEHFAF